MRHRSLASGATVAALYAVMTIALAPVSYGPIQFRAAEALTLLPWYRAEAVSGLFVGCIVANFFGGYGPIDMIVGSCATLGAALLTRRAPVLWAAALPPVALNAVVVGGMLHVLADAPLLATCAWVGLGEAGACILLGLPLMRGLERCGLLVHDAVGRGADT